MLPCAVAPPQTLLMPQQIATETRIILQPSQLARSLKGIHQAMPRPMAVGPMNVPGDDQRQQAGLLHWRRCAAKHKDLIRSCGHANPNLQLTLIAPQRRKGLTHRFQPRQIAV